MLITLKDGSREFENGMNALDIAGQLSQELKKQALAARVDGELVELVKPIDHDCTLEILTFEDDEAKRVLRHTASHVLAQAVKHLKPEAKLAIGPAIDNGFYYDFDVDEPFTPEFLTALEKEMKKIIQKNDRLERFELPREEAIRFMEEKGEPYKVELIRDLPEDAAISFYRQGDFTDLCAGPHLPSTGNDQGLQAHRPSLGAYWRGNEKNKMLQRIYGTAFTKKEDLDAYLQRIEEAKKARSPQAGPRTGSVRHPGRGPRLPLLLSQGNDSAQRAGGLLAARFTGKRAMRRSKPPSCSTALCGSAPAIGIITKKICTPPRSTIWISPSSP